MVNEDAHVVRQLNEAEHQFIIDSIKRQGEKRYTSFKSVVAKAILLFVAVGVCLTVICLAVHSYNWKQTKQQLETEALIKQLEKGEVVEMTARVGGQHE